MRNPTCESNIQLKKKGITKLAVRKNIFSVKSSHLSSCRKHHLAQPTFEGPPALTILGWATGQSHDILAIEILHYPKPLKTTAKKNRTLLHICLEDSPTHQKHKQKQLVQKDNYSLTKVFMESTSQDPVFVSRELRSAPESYALLLWGTQFPHASYPRQQLFDKFLK